MNSSIDRFADRHGWLIIVMLIICAASVLAFSRPAADTAGGRQRPRCDLKPGQKIEFWNIDRIGGEEFALCRGTVVSFDAAAQTAVIAGEFGRCAFVCDADPFAGELLWKRIWARKGRAAPPPVFAALNNQRASPQEPTAEPH